MRVISIYLVRTGEFLVAVAETSTGLRVVRGREDMLERLGLLKYGGDIEAVKRAITRATELYFTEGEPEEWSLKYVDEYPSSVPPDFRHSVPPRATGNAPGWA